MLLVLVIGGVIRALYKVAKEYWEAGERILGAFAALLGVLVRPLPSVLLAGKAPGCSATLTSHRQDFLRCCR